MLSPLGNIVVRRMFGGGGVCCDGLMFGLVSNDTLYFKTSEESRKSFEAEGCGPFVYQGKGRPITMSYWRVPERLLDEPGEMVAWARISFGIAQDLASAMGKKSTVGTRSESKDKFAGKHSK